MITPDANIILYAYNEDAPQHQKAKDWLENQISLPKMFGLSWQVITAFLRISTNHKAFPIPFDLQEATEIIDEWLEHPKINIIVPTDNHWKIFRGLIDEGQTNAALMMDAHLAALAIEHGATLVTTDRDFTRFSNLKTLNPLK